MTKEARFGPPTLPPASATHLAEVVSVEDPDSRNRIQVRLLSYDGPDDQDAAFWARVAVPFAGNERGAFFIPGVGEEVVQRTLQVAHLVSCCVPRRLLGPDSAE